MASWFYTFAAGLTFAAASCASVPMAPPLSLCERLHREDPEWTGWSVYGENVRAECLDHYIGRYMIVIKGKDVPYTYFRPRTGQLVRDEVIPIYDNRERAREGADFIHW